MTQNSDSAPPERVWFRRRVSGLALRYSSASILDKEAYARLGEYLVDTGHDIDKCEVDVTYRVLTPFDLTKEHS